MITSKDTAVKQSGAITGAHLVTNNKYSIENLER